MKDWTNRLQPGDVVRFPSGALRVVRAVKHPDRPTSSYGDIYRSSITFSIKRCSWTHRCHTTYTSSDLRTLGCVKTRAKVLLRKKIDRLISEELRLNPDKPMLTCCDVKDAS